MENINAALTDRYRELRDKIEKSFDGFTPIKEQEKEYISPSGKYLLCITPYKTEEGCWDYTKGVVYDNTTGEVIFSIFRNYSSFWHQWIEHQNGKEYLLCGEDYQGYVCINLTDKQKHVFFPENGFKGWGFCWILVREYDKEYDTSIRVEGCYWACPYEIVEYDFSEPDVLPYKEISREYEDYEEEDENIESEEDEKEEQQE